MKVEKISSNVLRLSEKISDNEYHVQYSTHDGTIIAEINIEHPKREFSIVLNIEALKYPSTLLAIANFLAINSVFLKSNGISVPNCYGYVVKIEHKKFN